jgi:hypothetical protein
LNAPNCEFWLVELELNFEASIVSRESARLKSCPVAAVKVPSFKIPEARLVEIPGDEVTTVVFPPKFVEPKVYRNSVSTKPSNDFRKKGETLVE